MNVQNVPSMLKVGLEEGVFTGHKNSLLSPVERSVVGLIWFVSSKIQRRIFGWRFDTVVK